MYWCEFELAFWKMFASTTFWNRKENSIELFLFCLSFSDIEPIGLSVWSNRRTFHPIQRVSDKQKVNSNHYQHFHLSFLLSTFLSLSDTDLLVSLSDILKLAYSSPTLLFPGLCLGFRWVLDNQTINLT
jgi:hypothetical protein